MKLLSVIVFILFSSTINAQDPVVAYTARLNTPLVNAPSGVVIYEETTANSGNWYDNTTGGFTIPADNYGIYYMGLSLGVPTNGTCSTNIHQAGTGRVFTGIKFDNTNIDGNEYASRGFMRELTTTMTKAFEVQNDAGCSMLGDPYGTSTWTMFRYRDISDLSISFSVARQNNFEEQGESIDWQREFVNDGVAEGVPLNATTGYFEAPVDAYYFFHMSSMSQANTPMQAALVHWPAMLPMVNFVCLLNRESGDADGLDTTSRSLILRLYKFDQVSMGNLNNSVLASSNDGYELSFSGFAYANDTSDPQSVAFCAYMIDWLWTPDQVLPLTDWTAANVNFDGSSATPPFNLTTGIFETPMDGTYFISFSVGIQSNQYCLVALTDQFNNKIALIDRQNTVHQGIDTLSRDIVVDLKAGDELKLQAYVGTGLVSTYDGKETSFMAMRMRETN